MVVETISSLNNELMKMSDTLHKIPPFPAASPRFEVLSWDYHFGGAVYLLNLGLSHLLEPPKLLWSLQWQSDTTTSMDHRAGGCYERVIRLFLENYL